MCQYSPTVPSPISSQSCCSRQRVAASPRLAACNLPGAARSARSDPQRRPRNSIAAHAMKALIFDCDGVILESEDLHRRAYNAAFSHFNVKCGGAPVEWSESFHSTMERTVGLGFKLKLRWFFQEKGWPSSTALDQGQGQAAPPETEAQREQLLESLQSWKNTKYQEMIKAGEAETRPGVLRLMDEAREAGLKLGVCSAATRSTVAFTLQSLLGQGRFDGLDCFIAGDDVVQKKPDPEIYTLASQRLGVKPEECVVVEDSGVGVQAAREAGMRCIVTYTSSSKYEQFPGAERIVQDLGSFPAQVTVKELQERRIVQDDRIEMSLTDGAVYFHIPEQER